MLNVEHELLRLHRLTVSELKVEYERLTGEPARSNNRVFLVKRIVWRAQAADQGGLTERAIARAAELAREADLRVRPRPEIHAAFAALSPGGSPAAHLPAAGAVLTREYRGRRLSVTVLDRGFEFEGKNYSSLSAVAKAATGADWNGRLFFGLTDRKARA
ncbi:MAG TPA: DUF2924 domain-containing protein [Phycisphaerales bacterium]|nr:DUF2924 domain-containing protein [Phycisphaerales bacterium]